MPDADSRGSEPIELIDYDLPPDLIAQKPAETRDASRLLVLPRDGGNIEHARFDQIGNYLRSGDLLVVNNTEVVPFRLRARKSTGGAVELLLLEYARDQRHWRALLRPGKAGREGREFRIEGEDSISIRPVGRDHEIFFLEFRDGDRALEESEVVALCRRRGETPLPPYIRRDDAELHSAVDRERYQTVYASKPGAAAAPTAGLHFTPELLARLDAMGIERAEICLHVGVDTFKPLDAEQLASGRLHGERIEISPDAGEKILGARTEGRRIIAVGTTSARALESLDEEAEFPFAKRTTLFIRPGHRFRRVDALITNFHLPRSSLLLLVSAFASRDSILAAYREAIANRYRFFSYGDAMLII